METVNVIKVGGAILENKESLAALLDRFAAMPGRKVLVHGGGRSATQVAAQLGVETHMVEGRRITDEAMLHIVTMVYAGLVNKNAVAALQARGVNAMGLCGADMDFIRGHKRPVKQIDYGWVGDIDRVDTSLLRTLIAQGVVPVVAPLSHDGEGHLLNTNADTIASEVAVALARDCKVTLTFCFEKPGVLRDADNDASVIPHIDRALYAQLKADGTVSGGMLPKIDNAFVALDRGVSRVYITRADNLDGSCGTLID